MHKFFVEEDQINGEYIEIRGKDVRHISNVLRCKIKEKIEVNVAGFNHICQIEEMEKDTIVCRILESRECENESDIELILYQGLPKGTKTELILQKSTEVGVKDFYLYTSERSIVKIKDEKKERSKIDRWNLICEEAAKQSKRDYIPSVKDILNFKEMLEGLSGEIIVPYENEEKKYIGEALKDIGRKKVKKINLIIGPEGGFEKWEIEMLKEKGAHIVSLGPRILRTETAAIVSSALILYELSNVGVI